MLRQAGRADGSRRPHPMGPSGPSTPRRSISASWVEPSITRASHVEPDQQGRWLADLTPVAGPVLGPFERRSEALEAEQSWLAEHWLVHQAELHLIRTPSMMFPGSSSFPLTATLTLPAVAHLAPGARAPAAALLRGCARRSCSMTQSQLDRSSRQRSPENPLRLVRQLGFSLRGSKPRLSNRKTIRLVLDCPFCRQSRALSRTRPATAPQTTG